MLQTERHLEQLAVDGGLPVRTHPFAPWPRFGKRETRAATQVLRSGRVNYWTGEEGRRFEEEFAAACGCRYAVAVANGTLALELALYALGVGQGDEVIVSCRTFIASASCIVARGAIPVLADVDPVSQNITAETMAAVLTQRTKAVIAVHLAGWPCDMDSIGRLARKHSLKVVEDCAQAQGACYKGRPVGSVGDVAAFSFCQDKIMTTGGEGGMLVTQDEEVWRRSWSYKDHGKDYAAVHAPKHHPGFRWVHHRFGTNWRLTEIQAAIGRVLLTRVSEWVERRRRLAAILTERLSHIPALRVTVPPGDITHSYYRYYVFIRPERLREGWDRDRVLVALSAEGIPCGSGICGELYREKAFDGRDRPPSRLSVARDLAETSLMLLVHPTLRARDMQDTCRALEKVMAAACR